jgi:hypothetical protein
VCINVLLLDGQGTEAKPLHLVIDEIPSCHSGCHCHRCSVIVTPPEHSGCHCHRCSVIVTPPKHSGCHCHHDSL